MENYEDEKIGDKITWRYKQGRSRRSFFFSFLSRRREDEEDEKEGALFFFSFFLRWMGLYRSRLLRVGVLV